MLRISFLLLRIVHFFYFLLWALFSCWRFINSSITKISRNFSIPLTFKIISLTILRCIFTFILFFLGYSLTLLLRFLSIIAKIALPIFFSALTEGSKYLFFKVFIIPALRFSLSSYIFYFFAHNTTIIIITVPVGGPVFVIWLFRSRLINTLTYSLMDITKI